MMIKNMIVIAGLILLASCNRREERPNILVLMSDNQYWEHLGVNGDHSVRTPHIDSVARKGTRFQHAFCAAPSCTPSRAAFLTGQDIWRLEEGTNLWGTLPAKFKTYVDLLEESGYSAGFQGKGWGPGEYGPGGRSRNPGGNKYDSFDAFLKEAPADKPWTYWFSSRHPHRPFQQGAGAASGIDPGKIKLPSYLPDTDSVRSDIADYYAAVESFDTEVGEILRTLKEKGQYDNTVIVICSDNGWQMPRGLANLYDFGSRVPLIISYAGWSQQERVLEDFVNLYDLAPTFLELAQTPIPGEFTAKSLLPLLLSDKEAGRVDTSRDAVFMARERHAYARKSGEGYPGRAIRTDGFLYIRNYEPGRWPAGDPPLYGDVDAHMLHYSSPTKVEVIQSEKRPDSIFFRLAFAKRPAEELYDLAKDKDQLHNRADDRNYTVQKEKLVQRLDAYLLQTGDPRATGGPVIWDTAPYYNDRDKSPRPDATYRKLLELDSLYQYN